MRVFARPAAVAIAVTVVLAGAGTAAARLDPFGDRQPDTRTSLLSGLGWLDELDVHVVDDAASAAAETGVAVPTIDVLPAAVSGEPRYLVAGRGVAAVWSRPTGIPALILARVATPPDLPVAALISSIPSLAGDHLTVTHADVHGTTVTVATTSDRSASGVVWIEDDVANLVAGTLDTSDVLAVARSLR